ncbi:exocyst complex protein exo70 [Bimuria novae-zelandiae CBS 107.79]|uniref:Exocyst complex protein EXO70 n=1 Tax=Bimuria novae-zelandiae CBS 107.79 TaxID=1447943 RepID=A0A6A5USA6_9PLEO|nr:exocyst complex protein exo70 [Bimuria novae-zelandiae CBS 107.79]
MVAPRKGAFAEEAAEVEVLESNIEKMKTLTKKIQASRNRLETSGKAMNEAMAPIYGNTAKLQTTNRNIDRILDAIDKLRAPLDQSNREDPIINKGLRNVDLQDYIASLGRTSQSLAELRRTNMRANQQAVAEMSALLKRGLRELEDVFRDILRDSCRQTVVPLEYVMKNNPFPTIPQEQLSTLRLINTHISNSFAQISQPDVRETPTQKIYAEIRGEYVTRSLQDLAAASINTAKKVAADAIYRKGTNGIGIYAQGMEGMFVAEYDNITNIFPRDEWTTVCGATCGAPLADFTKTLRELNGHIQRNLMTDCFLGYEIVEIASKLSMRLEQRMSALRRPIQDSIKPVRETSKSSMNKLLEDTRARIQTLVALPMDGAAVPVTTATMTRLQEMTNYLSPISSILASLGDGGWKSSATTGSSSSLPLDVGPDGQRLFEHYASDTIETLLQNLDGKSRALMKNKSLQGVFLSNNAAIVERMIRSSELAPLMEDYMQRKLEPWKKKASSWYLEAWREPSGYLLDVQYTNRKERPHSSSAGSADSVAIVKALGSKDKDAIKEKFKSFNTSFEELSQRHKSYKMEREVRMHLGKEVQNIMEPLYSRFWDRYHEIDKGKGKYVKYSKVELGQALSGLS